MNVACINKLMQLNICHSIYLFIFSLLEICLGIQLSHLYSYGIKSKVSDYL